VTVHHPQPAAKRWPRSVPSWGRLCEFISGGPRDRPLLDRARSVTPDRRGSRPDAALPSLRFASAANATTHGAPGVRWADRLIVM